jgi:inosine/xanthosine triphosphatase
VSGEASTSPLAALREVRVGSANQPKVDAVRSALRAFAPRVRVEGVEVSSGVSEQPVGWEEIVRGARNRARRAREVAACDLAVGIEDGLVALPDAEGVVQHVNVGCAAVVDRVRTSIGFSSAFAYPPACTDRAVNEREPIGPLFDALWSAHRGRVDAIPSGRTVGNVGKLTWGALPRSEYARQAVLCALVSFLNPDLYGTPETGT